MSATPSPLVARYGPWAVVTGASSGIGREVAVLLAASGMHLVLVARRAEALQALAATLATRYGIQTRVLPLDVGHATHLAALATATDDLDVGLLVAAAGFGTSGPFLEADLETEAALLAVNAHAVLAQCWHFGRRFAAQRRGGLVLVSSILAFQGTPWSAHYAATKAYVQSLAEGLRVELAPHGVKVLVSAPGPTDTGFAARARMNLGNAMTPAQVARPTLAALGRTGTVRPGPLSKLLALALAPLPRWARVRVLGQVMRGMTRRVPTSLTL